MEKVIFTNNNPNIIMSAVINVPDGFDEKRTCLASAISHPGESTH